jgi:hypothetical protein
VANEEFGVGAAAADMEFDRAIRESFVPHAVPGARYPMG